MLRVMGAAVATPAAVELVTAATEEVTEAEVRRAVVLETEMRAVAAMPVAVREAAVLVGWVE